jgi:hypothetical protein
MKYVSTTDDSLGARFINDDKIAVARLIEGKRVIEIIEDAEQIKGIIDKALPILQHILQALIDFFRSFNPFHTVLVIDGKNYIYTEQKAPLKAIDSVFYMNDDDKNDIIFRYDAIHMQKAKKELKKELKTLGYIK